MSLRPAEWTSIIGNMSLLVFTRFSLFGSNAHLDLLNREVRHLEISEENFTHVNDKSDVKGMSPTAINKMLYYVRLAYAKGTLWLSGLSTTKNNCNTSKPTPSI